MAKRDAMTPTAELDLVVFARAVPSGRPTSHNTDVERIS